MPKKETFYGIERKQKLKSFIVFLFLFLVYIIGIGIIYIVGWYIYCFIVGAIPIISLQTNHILIIIGIAFITVLIQWIDIKRNGAEFILKILNAQEPDKDDLYHKKLVNVSQELTLSSGFKHLLRVYVVPSSAVNSFALVDKKKNGIIGVTEGAVATLERDELQTIVAHELAHIIRGDAIFVTLACSVTNFLNSIAESIRPDEENTRYAPRQETGATQITIIRFLLYFIIKTVSLIMRFLSLLISRQREYLADATAVEFTRNPSSLASAIYKAHKYFSFIGDYTETYSPIFIVSPESLDEPENDNIFKRMFGTHPPDKSRINKLLSMTGATYEQLASEVKSKEAIKDYAREEIKSIDEETGEIKGLPLNAFGIGSLIDIIKKEEQSSQPNLEEEKLWEVRDCHGEWLGPFKTNELFSIPWFTGLSRIRPLGEDIEVYSRSFPEILEKFRYIGNKGSGKGECPFCQTPLLNSYYEGVPIKFCRRCGGRLVQDEKIIRILSRKGIKPSPFLKDKSLNWAKQNYLNFQIKGTIRKPISKQTKEELVRYLCPQCGSPMIRKTFTYQYFVLIDYCGMCKAVWFDGDELEMLQVLIEKSMSKKLSV